ncbi:MAG: hypothetical protein OHK0029_06980 [Armatimonadaceae bacterium]
MHRTDTLTITDEFRNRIAPVDEFKGAWRALGTRTPVRLSALWRVATIGSMGSSTSIVGNRLFDRQVNLSLSHLKIHSFNSRDNQEVVRYAAVMNLVFDAWYSIRRTQNEIKQLHKLSGFFGLLCSKRDGQRILPKKQEGSKIRSDRITTR